MFAGNPTAQLGAMTATAVLSSGPEPTVVGCTILTPKFSVRVEQTSGFQRVVGGHGIFVPNYTWLEMHITVKPPLARPVTGIMGATYTAGLALPSSHRSPGGLPPSIPSEADDTQPAATDAGVAGSEADASSEGDMLEARRRSLMDGNGGGGGAAGWAAGMTLSASIGL